MVSFLALHLLFYCQDNSTAMSTVVTQYRNDRYALNTASTVQNKAPGGASFFHMKLCGDD
jgi:hypothetical protein